MYITVTVTVKTSHSSFPLVPNDDLNDPERRNDRYFCLISPNSVPPGPITSQWLKSDRRRITVINMYPKHQLLATC